MERWALISGLKGDLELYEQIQQDLKTHRGVDNLFVLGDVIGPERNCNALLNRLQHPKAGELRPQCIYGWWEEQLLAETGFRGESKADALRLNHGDEMVEALLRAVDPAHLRWLVSLQFGFIELDCGLIHGSSADIGDSLTPQTSPLILLDRLTRLDVNRLFTARSGEQFRLELTGGGIDSHVKDLRGQQKHQQSVPKRSIIGIGCGARFTVYDPGSDRVDFLQAGATSPSRSRQRGFG